MLIKKAAPGMLALALSFGLLTASPIHATDLLDNAQVVQMVKLGLDNDTIRAKIESSRSNFDTSPAALSQLQADGVPSELIQAMIRGGGNASASAPAASGRASFVLRAGGQDTSINPVRVTSQLSHRKRWIPVYGAFANPETFMTIQGRNAPVSTGAQPEFVTSIDPLKVRLLHMGHDRSNNRYVVFDGSTSDREINVDHEEIGGGLFRLRPAQPLQAGQQYAFMVVADLPSGMGFWAWFVQPGNAAVAYDFGVN